MRLRPGSAPGPLGKLTALPRPAAFREVRRTAKEKKSGEGKWSGKEEKGMGGERSCSSKNISLKYFGPGPTKITVTMCSLHRYRLIARCAITCPVLGKLSRCGWSALKPSADRELLTAIRVLSNCQNPPS